MATIVAALHILGGAARASLAAPDSGWLSRVEFFKPRPIRAALTHTIGLGGESAPEQEWRGGLSALSTVGDTRAGCG